MCGKWYCLNHCGEHFPTDGTCVDCHDKETRCPICDAELGADANNCCPHCGRAFCSMHEMLLCPNCGKSICGSCLNGNVECQFPPME